MSYPMMPDFNQLAEQLAAFSSQQHEYGSNGISDILSHARDALVQAVNDIKSLPADPTLAQHEPNQYQQIRQLRTEGPRKIWDSFCPETYAEKLEGALLSRLAGCTLGTIVEGWPIEKMEQWARYIGDTFPPTNYWSAISNPLDLRFGIRYCDAYIRKNLNGVPIDDDTTYTLLGLLIAEEYGTDFTTDDVGKAWLKHLPLACTAEHIALNNLKAGCSSLEAAEVNNPYQQWIGADIRSDAWAYIAPGYPEKAAELAYKDAYISHRRNGIYGEMFFSAAQSAAFCVDHPNEALKIGLTEIPKECTLYKDVTWALEAGKDMHNYKDARQAVDERFAGMNGGHTNNNACLSIFGLMLGGNDVNKVLSQTVAMGLDNDCTTATAGSIVGAIVGKRGVPEHWYRNFNNRIFTYMIGNECFEIDNVIERFTRQAEKTYGKNQ